MKKRPIVYLITAALLTLTVSGCGSEKTEKQTKQPTEKEPHNHQQSPYSRGHLHAYS